MSTSGNFRVPSSSDFDSPKRRGVFSIFIGAVVVLFVAFTSVSGFVTDRMWFDSLGQTTVFDTLLLTKLQLFLVVGVVSAVVVGLNVWIAFRSRPVYVPRGAMSDIPGLEKTEQVLKSIRRFGLIAGPVVIGALMGLGATESWQQWLSYRNAQPFGQVDATFGLDLSFFVFELPMLMTIQSWLTALVVVSVVAAGAIHFLVGNLRPGPRPVSGRLNLIVADVARRQAAVLIGFYFILQAASQWLDRFNLTLADNDVITGMTYVDDNVHLPALNMMAGISLVCAVLFFLNVLRTNWTLPILGVALTVVASIALQGIWPSFVQQVQVKPDEQAKESPYIAKNIEATRLAYGIDGVQYESYDAVETPDAEILKGDKDTLENIRLLDPYVVASTFEQLQQLKGFYSFAPTLDISRYNINGDTRGALLAVREVNLDGIPESQRNWVTSHLIYTHGIGLAAAYDNTATSDGQPDFIESDVPPTGALGIEEPRIYFGEQSPVYSIVGGASGIELDYPDDTAPSGQHNTTYTGKGGVPVGNMVNKLLFAARFGEPNIFLSEQVTDSSRILFNRAPAERVQAVAPWLTLDSDPYPAVVSGRIVWIVDGYTLSSQYPYAQYTGLSDAVADSFGARSNADGQINYIRNSVKATVDAFDGTVTLYAWDENDPILKSWKQVFPELLRPKSEMSNELLAQVRYPEDLFKVQRNVLRKYHISDPAAFFTGENFWIIPDDPTLTSAGLPQPPYYLNLKMPGEAKSAFSLTSTFAPAKRPSLAAFMAVNSDPGPDYGKIRVLQLPSQTTIPGPVQAQNIFESDAAISTALSLLRKGGSDTVQGNLLSLPVGGGILYVQPVYVKSTGAGGFPLLRKVMVGFGQKVVLADTVSAALEQVLGGSVVDPGGNDDPVDPNQSARAKLVAALTAAQNAYAEGEAALKQGDFAAYGAAQKRLAVALAQAEAAAAAIKETATQ